MNFGFIFVMFKNTKINRDHAIFESRIFDEYSIHVVSQCEVNAKLLI